jgi:hypothetical protein
MRLEALKAVVTECDIVAAGGFALHLAALLLAEFDSLWNQV